MIVEMSICGSGRRVAKVGVFKIEGLPDVYVEKPRNNGVRKLIVLFLYTTYIQMRDVVYRSDVCTFDCRVLTVEAVVTTVRYTIA